MNHKEKLKNIYSLSFSISDIKQIPQQYLEYILLIGDQAYKQKGVYTVLVTLLTHKSLFPEQDIRRHQSSMPGGFSGRTIDTVYITPTLKELGLPSMAESGWLTRSLEQPYPYNLDYQGKISNKAVKKAFLSIIDYVQSNPDQADNVLRLILNKVIDVQAQSIVNVAKLVNPDTLNILSIISCLEEHFSTKYQVRGGSKLPVLAIYAAYKSLLDEVKRYENCILAPLGSHTASDLTSRSSGDIEVFDEQGQICEAIEVKHEREIDLRVVRVAYEKIIRFNPKRYYILSCKNIKASEIQEINNIISQVREEHGCQIIINGVIPSIKYYLRLIALENFVSNYSNLVSIDTELQAVHKIKWNELIDKLSLE
ncbi:MAG: hypothetical protein ACRC62_16900 [Microcoleus sp.]